MAEARVVIDDGDDEFIDYGFKEISRFSALLPALLLSRSAPAHHLYRRWRHLLLQREVPSVRNLRLTSRLHCNY